MRAIVLALIAGLLGAPAAASAAGPTAPPAAAPPAAAPPAAAPNAPTQDAGWPRQLQKEGASLVYYQPQLDEWKDYKELKCRIAFSLTPKGGTPVLGVATLGANTLVDREARTVFLRDITVISVRFPSADAATAAKLEELLRSMIPTGGEPVSIDRAMATIERDKVPAKAAPIKNDAPPIVTSAVPAVLLLVDGAPVGAPIEGTDLQFVVNANWDLFYEQSTQKYFLLVQKTWLTSSSADLRGPWTPTRTLPKDMAKLPEGQNFDDVKKLVPAPATSVAPRVYYSKVPAELILLAGAPVYQKIPGTALVYVTNTENDLFANAAKDHFYVRLSGRWFESQALAGPWTYAGATLPADFAKIPPTSPKGRVLVSVPGTQENADAVMLAQIPTTAVVDKAAAAAAVKVSYDGAPQFLPIPGTNIAYAANTEQRVLKVNNTYYLCFEGVWFVAFAPTGPWRTADSVPPEIYTIPPSSPVYNVTYVTQTNATPTTVESSYSSGYYGSFVFSVGVGFAIGYGTGWYYPPYYGPPGSYYPYRPYGPTYGVGAVYNPATGGYAVGRAAYGPYGAAGGAAWYNPQTGRYGRAASAQSWYGGRTVATSYNPWTGTRARTTQSNNSYAQWGSSVATRGNQWVQTGHVTTAGGTTAAYRTSGGKSGVVRRNENGTVARTDNGVYAGRDGNVYKRNGKGDWSQYQNGGWNQVDRKAPQAGDLDRSARDRQRGQTNSDRNRARAPSGGGSGAGRAGGGGARMGGGGGGRRR